jgi:hypothetical protein
VFDHEYITAIGAILSGFGSVTAAVVSATIAHRRARDECDKRIENIKEAYREGVSVGKMMKETK